MVNILKSQPGIWQNVVMFVIKLPHVFVFRPCDGDGCGGDGEGLIFSTTGTYLSNKLLWQWIVVSYTTGREYHRE